MVTNALVSRQARNVYSGLVCVLLLRLTYVKSAEYLRLLGHIVFWYRTGFFKTDFNSKGKNNF